MSATPALLSTPPNENAQLMSLTDILVRAAEQFQTSGAYLSAREGQDAEFMTYPALLKEARCILGGLHSRALPAKSKVALLLERPRDFMPAFWACVLGGYVPCPLTRTGSDPERWAKHVAYVDTLLERPVFVSTDRLTSELPPEVNSARLDDLRASLPCERIHKSSPSDPAVLMLTSGSTGNAKAVELTHRNVLASMVAKVERHRWTSTDIAFNWVGFDHVAALLESHMVALYVGAAQVHAEPAHVLADPLQFLRLIDRYRVSITFAPNFLLGQINGALQSIDRGGSEPLQLDLSCLRRILTGGEANVVQTSLRFLDLLAGYGLKRSTLCPIYGLTETCAAVVYSLEFPEFDLTREFATVGLPVEGQEVRVADESGRSMPDGDSGEVQLRGPIVFGRYYNNPEATSAAFTDDGWFRTGDLGRIDNERLTIVARIKDSIIVNGVNYFGHELEAQLQQLEGIERSFAAAFPTRPKGADTEQLVVAFATPYSNDTEALYQLIVAVRNTTIMLWGFRPALILPLPTGAFPKTSLGKIQRSLMRKRLESGVYDAEVVQIAQVIAQQVGAYVAPEGVFENSVTQIYAEILGVDSATLSASVSFFDLGGTSLDILKLTQTIERRCGVPVQAPVIIQNPTVRQLAAQIANGAQGGIAAYDPIVPLQTTGKKTPLFCVHPGNSEVLVLVNLAKYFLYDRPFYALRARGFNEGESCFGSVEEAVGTYLDAILERQPKGPYAIAGYSMGVLLAFEISRQLEARGHEVAFLGAIDYVPHHEPISAGFTLIATAVAWVLGLIDIGKAEQIRAEIPDAPISMETCEYILQSASRSRLAELNLDLPRFFTWARVGYSTERMLLARVTSGKVRNMTVFCSDGIAAMSTGDRWREQLRGWNQFTSQPARFVDVPGDHFNLMSPKHVATFQALLRAEIDLALGNAPSSAGAGESV